MTVLKGRSKKYYIFIRLSKTESKKKNNLNHPNTKMSLLITSANNVEMLTWQDGGAKKLS